MYISAKQCRAARELLNWKQEELARNSEININTISAFERGTSQPYKRTMKDLVLCLVGAGIKFVDNDEGIGVILLKEEVNQK